MQRRRGEGEPRQIVCGAWNFEAGATVALPGAVLPDGRTLERAKLRGTVSDGMILSESELSISDEHAGILVLPEPWEPGTPLGDVLPLGEEVLEIEVTRNRPDCLSVYGIAREVAALFRGELRPMPGVDPEPAGDETLDISIEDFEGCPRYVGRLFRDVRIRESPPWTKARLSAAGMRPISNVVDVTNYVMLALGNPLHAFDHETLAGSRIVVRRAREGEEFTSLDGKLRKLDPSDLVIADGERAIAFAGIMGGLDTEVTEKTTSVLLEAANFEPGTILWSSSAICFARRAPTAGRRASTPTSLRTPPGSRPSSWSSFPAPAGRATQTSSASCPSRRGSRSAPSAPTGSWASRSRAGAEGRARRARVRRRARLERDRAFLARPRRHPGDRPGRGGRARPRARAHPVHAPAPQRHVRPAIEAPAPPPARRGRARRAGLFEVYTLSFVGEDPDPDALRLPDPLSSDHEILRTSLLFGLTQAARHNVNAGNEGIGLFEIARVYLPSGSSCRTSTGTSAWSSKAATRGPRGSDTLRRARHRAAPRADEPLVPPPGQGRRARGGLGRRAPSGAPRRLVGRVRAGSVHAVRPGAGAARVRRCDHVPGRAPGPRVRGRRGRARR